MSVFLIERVKRSGAILVSGVAVVLLFLVQSVLATEPLRSNDSWPNFGYDQANTNFNPFESRIRSSNVAFLRRSWETFNDTRSVDAERPSGFVLESVLGLTYPESVVGVTASPLVDRDVLYYVDQLGTVFARDPRTGEANSPVQHWTTTLVDADYDSAETPILPELIYTSPVLTRDHIWIVGSVYGRLHAIERAGGREVDFDRSTPEIDAFPLISDLPFASVLGDSTIVHDDHRTLFITGINVILNDALVQGEETGVQIAFDITDPAKPFEVWRTFSIDIDPTTGARFGSGASIGAGLSVDTELGYIFGGTGQNTTSPYPEYPDPSLAPDGYVDRSDSLYAIDYRTGEFAWFNQLHDGDVFNLNYPVGTGPNNPDGPRDADVLSPPVLYDFGGVSYASVGSKGGIYRSVNRQTGETVWSRNISKRTGIGGVQGGGAFANGVLYVAGFEGIDDGFSDSQFGSDTIIGNFPNAFFATFSPNFWADVENTEIDSDPSTGMRIKVFALNPATGESLWRPDGEGFVELLAGASLRHVTVANDVVFVATTSGELFALDAANGDILFRDQTENLNANGELGFAEPHHSGMNSGVIVAQGQVFAAHGHQNVPSGGIFAYELNRAPTAQRDVLRGKSRDAEVKPLRNDRDDNGDALRLVSVAGRAIDDSDRTPDVVALPQGQLIIHLPGDDGTETTEPTITFNANGSSKRPFRVSYTVEDVAPSRVVNGQAIGEPNQTHTPRRDSATILIIPSRR